MVSVGSLMTRVLVTLEESDELGRAEALFREHRIRHLPVVRADQLVGLVSHRDLLGGMAMGLSLSTPVSEVMVTELTTVSATAPVRYALQLILDGKLGCLPVVDDAHRLVGILTETDLEKYCGYLLRDIDARSSDEPS